MSPMRLAAFATIVAGLAIGLALAAWQRGDFAKHVATAPPTAAASSLATAGPRAAAVPAAAAAPPKEDYSALQGAWQIDEANTQVGRMVWSVDAATSSGGEIVLDARKDSIAGRAATPCERQTSLHAVVVLGVAPQMVPFREVNCEGATMSGEIRVSSFARNRRSFHGSFWLGGVNVGDFTATKR